MEFEYPIFSKEYPTEEGTREATITFLSYAISQQQSTDNYNFLINDLKGVMADSSWAWVNFMDG